MEWNAYHFVGDTLRDGSPVPPDGEKLIFTGKLIMCESGFHASRPAWQALQYATGDTLCRVRCEGDMIEEPDKLVCTERTIVGRINATPLLRQYARECASDVVHLWNAPEVVLQFLKTGDPALRDAAWTAAGAARAAEAAVWAAAWDVRGAGEAAWTARAAARYAGAAGDAAWTARDAAWAAARAAAGAAEAAARAAAEAAQRSRFTSLVDNAFKRDEDNV